MNKLLSPQRWLMALVLGFCLWQGFSLDPAHAALASALTYDRFLRYVEEGRVTDVRLLDNNLVAEVTAIDPRRSTPLAIGSTYCLRLCRNW
jgi:cell division protease FtsH